MFSCNLPPALFGRMTGIFYVLLVVTRGWNGYRNKSQHRKSTLEKKILPPFQQGFEPATFQSRVRCSNHWAIPAPRSLGVAHGLFVLHSTVSRLTVTYPAQFGHLEPIQPFSGFQELASWTTRGLFVIKDLIGGPFCAKGSDWKASLWQRIRLVGLFVTKDLIGGA